MSDNDPWGSRLPTGGRRVVWALLGLVLLLLAALEHHVLTFWHVSSPTEIDLSTPLGGSHDRLICYPSSAVLIDCYDENSWLDPTICIRFRMSAADLQSFKRQKAFVSAFTRPPPAPGATGWMDGKDFHQDAPVPWPIAWRWRDLWLANPRESEMWSGCLDYDDGAGRFDLAPSSVVVRPDRAGTVVVYLVYCTT